MNALVSAVNGPGRQRGGTAGTGDHPGPPPGPLDDQGPCLHFRPPLWRSTVPAGMVATAEVNAFPLDGASDWSRAGIESAGPGMQLSWQLPEVIKGSARLRSGPFFIRPPTLPAGRPFSPPGHGRTATYRGSRTTATLRAGIRRHPGAQSSTAMGSAHERDPRLPLSYGPRPIPLTTHHPKEQVQ